jgi:hypothetical protein
MEPERSNMPPSASPRFDRARSISCDFDGVLSTLVLGRRWVKTRDREKAIPILSPITDGLKALLGALSEALRGPFPHAEEVLRRLRSSERTLYVLSSRTGPGVGLARRRLERQGWRDLFEREFFNVDGEDADLFKARILSATPIDVHIDDDPETLAHLSSEFPQKLFVHMNYYQRESLTAPNVITVRSWRELPAIFFQGGCVEPAPQNEKAKPA